jgi:general secretion pathway protein K
LRRDESGVALVIVLTIVALLTIIVMEFTYNVQLDHHRTRNALDAMQAKLLARSGINLAETFLAEDEDENYDAFNEEWALALEEFCSGITIEPTMRLRCGWEDESGKININLTRPRNSNQQEDPNRVTADAVYRDALETVFRTVDIHIDDIGDKLRDYWASTPPGAEDDDRAKMPDFGSLEDFAAIFHVPPGKLGKLRRLLTAQPGGRLTRINVNTAPEDVLYAVLVGYGNEGGEEALQSVLETRQNDPPFVNDGAVSSALSGMDDKVRGALTQMLGAKSSYFRLQASGLTNTDPTGETPGGIGQTLSVLVRRTRQANQRGGGQQGNNGQQGINWTFRRLDWQIEAGARLFRTQETSLDSQDETDETDEDDSDND